MARLLVHARAGLEMTTSLGVCLDVATRRHATVLANLRRFAFLIRCGNALAGCALVTRGSSASGDPDAFDVAELFGVRAIVAPAWAKPRPSCCGIAWRRNVSANT